MNTSGVELRRVLALVAGLIGLFAVSIVLGGQLNDDYTQSRDFVSALSARGASNAWIGMGGLLAFSAANALTAYVLRTRSRAVSNALYVAALAGTVAALARIDCPGGAARCSLEQSQPESMPGDWIDALHGGAVFIYALALLAAVGVAAWQVSQLAWRLTFIVLGATSFLALALTSSDSPGTAQRVWLAANATALLALAVSPLGRGPSGRT